MKKVKFPQSKMVLHTPGVIFRLLLLSLLVTTTVEHSLAQAECRPSADGGAIALHADITSASSFASNNITGSRYTKTTADAKDESAKIKLFPDPVSDYLLVSTKPVETNATVTVMNLIGTVMLTESILPGGTNAVLDVKGIPRGIYVLVYENKNDKQAMKFVKN